MDEDFEMGSNLTDENIEILLEDAVDDDRQSFVYVRIFKEPDDEDIICRVGDEMQINCGRYSLLTKGTVEQLATIFMILFENDETFLEAAGAAAKALDELKNMNL